MLLEGVTEPVIATRIGSSYTLWDGYHRAAAAAAAAVSRGDHLPAIIGIKREAMT